MKYKISFLILFICAITFGQNTTVSGVVTDKDLNGEALPFANVKIVGKNIGATTDVDGKYAIKLEPGKYEIEFSFLGYETKTVAFSIAENEEKVINQTLGTGSITMQDVVVKAEIGREKETALLLKQKNAQVMQQNIGAQEMSRKGVSDVEEGLTKITGISKVGSRGIFVRGLEDRYNNLLINDLAAPTNNPFKKIIPLDLFSTDVVEVIEVFKTFNPKLYGSFTGGTFNILTSKSGKSVTKLNIGVGYTTNNNLTNFLTSEEVKSTKGFLGLTAKDRAIPSILGKQPNSYSFTPQESLNAFGSGYNVNDSKSPLNTSIGVLHSEKFELTDDRKISYLLSLNFDNKYSFLNGVDRTFNANRDAPFDYNKNVEDNKEYRYNTSLSTLVGINYETKKLNLSYNTMFIKTTESLIQDQYGVISTNSSNNLNKVLVRTNQLDVSNYWNNQLFGGYKLSDTKTLKGGVSVAFTKYDQPDRKFFQGTKIDNNKILTTIANNNFIRQFLKIDGQGFVSAFADYEYKFGKDDKKNVLNVGYNGNTSKMESSYRFVSPINISAPNIDWDLNSIDSQLSAYINSGLFTYRESSNATFKTKLQETTNAGYANILYHFNKLEANLGLRLENTIRTTNYRGTGSFTDPFVKKETKNFYILPSLNLKYNVNEKTNLRLAASKTYASPVIMEAFPIEYINADGTVFRGNAALTNSDSYNLDLKYELFPTNKEMLAIGLFGKQMKNPIERTFINNATTGEITSFLNSDRATLFGAELEFIFDFNRINKSLEDLSFGFNTSLLSSTVQVKDVTVDINGTSINSTETHKKRDLQGASKWIINADLKYQFNINANWKSTTSLVYSVFGKRIYGVGTNGMDHKYENPVNKLDFVWTNKINSHFDWKFSIDNLLDPRINLVQGTHGAQPIIESSTTVRDYKRGRSFSFSIGYTF